MTPSDPKDEEPGATPEMGGFPEMGADDAAMDFGGMPDMGADGGEPMGEPPIADAEPQMSDAASDFGAPLEGEVSAGPLTTNDGFEGGGAAERKQKRAVLGVPIEVVISVGKARPLLSELVDLRRDSVLSLDSKIEDPVDIMVGDRVIARGELQEIDESGRLGVRLTEVADLSQSV